MPYKNLELERKVIHLVKQGYIDEEVAGMVGYSPSNVYKIRKRNSLPANKRRKISFQQKTIFSEELFVAERRFGVYHRNKGLKLIHRPMIIKYNGETLIPSFYDPISGAFILVLSRQRWNQIRDSVVTYIEKFPFLHKLVLINSETLSEFRPTTLNDPLKKLLHENFIEFSINAS